MAFSLVSHLEAGLGFAGSTTSALNTTGAKLLYLEVGYLPENASVIVSDSKGNTWIPLTTYQAGSGGSGGTGNVGIRGYYCIGGTVGTGHTFTVTTNFTYIAVAVSAWSSSTTPVYNKSVGAASGGVTSKATGSATPDVNNSLIISGVASDVNDTYTPNSGFTSLGSVAFSSSNYRGLSAAYKIQTTAGAENVTWSKSDTGTNANMATNLAIFYDAADVTDTTDPSVSITEPDDDDEVSGDVEVVVTCSDNIGVTSLQLRIDGVNVGSPFTGSNITSHTFTWDSTTVVNGEYDIDVVAKDGALNDTISAAVSVNVNNPSALGLNFEELQLSKLLNITQLDLDMPLLSADFGDGYGAGVLSGKQSGLRLWTISSECLPDQDDWSIDYTVDDEDLTDTRFQYFWEFFRRHIALGNKPFWFTDPRTGRKFMASFIDKQISFEAVTAKLYAGGISIKQRRVVMVGISFRTEDGSVEEEE